MTQTLSGGRGSGPVPAFPLDPPTLAGLHVPRRFTRPGVDPLDEIAWERRRTVITNPDGSIVFKMDGVEMPADWSQLATDIVVSQVLPQGGPPRRRPGSETSVRQVVHRIAHTIRESGEQHGRLLRRPRRTPTPSRPSSRSCSSTRTAPSTRRCGSTAACGTSTASSGAGGNCALGRRDRRRSRETDRRLRAPAVLGLLHPVGRRRPDEHLRAREERGAPLQVRLGHRHELLAAARPAGEALRRRHVSRA